MTGREVTGPGGTILIIAHEWDAVAAEVAVLLRANSFAVASTTPTALCSGAITYVSDHGATMWASTVPGPMGGDDMTITSTELGAVLNRSVHLDPAGFADEDDESYAACERAALFTAMIASLDCPVINRSVGTTLAGPPHLEAEWMAAAVRCGLAVRSVSWTSDGVVLESIRRDVGAATIVGRRIVATPSIDVAAEWADDHALEAIALAGHLGCDVLHLELGETSVGRVVVTHIDPRPPQLAAHVVLELARHLTSDIAVAGAHQPALSPDLESGTDLGYAS